MEPNMLTIGDRIKARRLARGLSQQALAVLVGSHHSWVSDVERGAQHTLTLHKMWLLCRALELNMNQLTGFPADRKAAHGHRF